MEPTKSSLLQAAELGDVSAASALFTAQRQWEKARIFLHREIRADGELRIMSTLSPDRWQEISPHLDHALSLNENERAVWLEAFRASNPELADVLARLLEEHRSLAKDGFLEGNPPVATSATLLAGQAIGAYRLISPIGEGGMGSVWLAERSDGRFERRVAIKFLRFSFSAPGGAERFRRECSAIIAPPLGTICNCILHAHFRTIAPSKSIRRTS